VGPAVRIPGEGPARLSWPERGRAAPPSRANIRARRAASRRGLVDLCLARETGGGEPRPLDATARDHAPPPQFVATSAPRRRSRRRAIATYAARPTYSAPRSPMSTELDAPRGVPLNEPRSAQ
jgi:hypothetical protein